MGGKSKTVTNTTVQKTQKHYNITTQIGNTVKGSDNITLAGSNNVVSMSDFGAIKSAFDFAEDLTDDAFNTINYNNQGLMDTMAESNKDALDAVSEQTQQIIQAQKTAQEQSVDKFLGYVPIVLIVGGLAYVLKGNK